MKLVVCIKQVPMVSEVPWDAKSGRLLRERVEGMINPACKHALEAALRMKREHGGEITVVTMGPPPAGEALHEAAAMGADRGVLVTDRRIAGADTLATSYTLACAIRKVCPDFDLVFCGCHTSDSETAQVGPQLAEELGVPGVAYVEHLELKGKTLTMRRLSDNFLETLEMDLPGLVTISTREYAPRYVPMAGVEEAFGKPEIEALDAGGIGADPSLTGRAGSATKILDVYSPSADKKGVVLKGAPKKIVEQLFEKFGDRLGGVIGRDITAAE